MERPEPEEYQPPLRAWSHLWRLVVMLLLSASVWGPVAQREYDEHVLLVVLDLTLGLAAYVLVHLRRRWPVRVAMAVALMSAFSGVAAGPAVLAAASVATRRRWVQIAVVGSANFACGQFFSTMMPSNTSDPYWLTIAVNATATLGILGWGMYLGSRRELLWTLRRRAERAEAEQGLLAEQSRSNERARIAREMHDVLAHRISQISMHAGALSFRDDLTAEEMRASAGVIREKAHEALTDLRGVLGVLRDASGELLTTPQPTYCDLPHLVAEARETGLRVDFEDEIGAGERTVPDVVGRTVYRIVQEGITNARKHAPGALLSIEVRGDPEAGVDVTLRNPLGFTRTGTPGAGLGLIGLSERAAIGGGRLEHRRDGTSFVLHGWIPWPA